MKNVVEILDATSVKVAQLDQSECECTVHRKINDDWSCTLKYPIPPDSINDKSSFLKTWSARVRVRNIDITDDYKTFVVSKAIRSINASGQSIITCTGEHISIPKLSEEIIDDHLVFTNVSAYTILIKILTYSTVNNYTAQSGSIETLISLTISWESILSALQKILVLCQAEYSINEVTKKVSIYKTLGVNNSLYLRTDKNIKSIQVTQFNRNVINKLYGVGGGEPPITIAGARHSINSYNATTGVITCTGNKIVPEDTCWNTSWEVYFVTGAETGTAWGITECIHGTVNDLITVAPGASFVAGDKFIIRLVSDHSNENAIYATISQGTHGLIEGVYKNGQFTGALNLVNVPDLSGSYTGGLCAGWTAEGTPATKALNTDTLYRKYGSASQKIIGDAINEGISQVITITANKYYKIYALVYITTGPVSMTVTDSSGTYTVTKPTASTGWQVFSLAERFTGTSITLKIIQASATAATFYIDAVQCTEGALDYSFNANCDAKDLWNETFDKLMTVKDPSVEYLVTFIDLYSIDSGAFQYEQVSIGDTMTIYDTALGISNVTARVKEINQDIFNPEKTEFTISNI